MDKRSNNFGFWRARKSFQDLTKEIPNLVFPDMSLLKAKLESIIGGKSVELENINNVYINTTTIWILLHKIRSVFVHTVKRFFP